MTILNQSLLIGVICVSPLLLLAQPSEYVKDNKTRTVVPISSKHEKAPAFEPILTPTDTPTSSGVPSTTAASTSEIVTPSSTESRNLQPNNSQPSISAPVVTPPKEVVSKSVVEDALSALMRFEKKEVHFGTVKMGEHPSHIFYFKNTGQEPVEIELVSACDCTELDYSRAPIAVGNTGFVKATYMSERAPEAVNNKFDKEITIILKNKYPNNGYPMVETLKIQGNVVE